MATPHDAVIRTKLLHYMEKLERFDLMDLWEDMVGDMEDLDETQLCNLAKALLEKNLGLRQN